MRVCIVGAGVAGLQCLDVLADEHECHVFEASLDVGGVWARNYDGFGLQVPSELYEFVGSPHPERDGTFPPGDDVQRDIVDFVWERNLPTRGTFHLGVPVRALQPRAGGGWTVRTDAGEHEFDYCVVCTGMYSAPKLPEGAPEGALHTSSFTDARVCAGKRVVVVGGGKSAVDCAVAAAEHATHVTLVARQLHWPIPRRILGLVPFQWGTYSRLGHFLLPAHWDLTARERRAHNALRGLKWLVWRALECAFAYQFSLRQWPADPLEIDCFGGGQILTYQLRDLVASGDVTLVVGEPERDEATSAASADLVLYGTGFAKRYDLLEGCELDLQYDGLWLYRNILPPRVPNLAFVGAEVSTFNNILTHRLQAEWVRALLRGAHVAPSVDAMEAHVRAERAWKRSWMRPSAARASLVQLHMTRYHDDLCTDVGRPLPKTAWWQWVLPITARDYSP